MKRIILISLLALAGTAQAKDAEPQKDVATLAAPCAACHGENGANPTTPAYPVLAGQYPNYLEHALTEYKAGTRKNAIMNGQAAGLSPQEIHELAQFFGAQTSDLYTPSVHGELKK